MTLGRTLWKVIIIKLFIMFAVLKLFFFPDFLKTNFSTDEQRADSCDGADHQTRSKTELKEELWVR